VELSSEAAGRVLKEVLGPRLASPMRGFILRCTLDVAPDASLDDFIDEARRHPVFELRSRPEASSSYEDTNIFSETGLPSQGLTGAVLRATAVFMSVEPRLGSHSGRTSP
jgi:hypothetical protein